MDTIKNRSGIRGRDSFPKILGKVVLSYWKYLLFWLFFCILAGYMYLRYAPRTFLTGAKIILQDEKKPSGEMSGLPELSNLAKRSVSSAAFVNDQIQVLGSRRLFRNVVLKNSLQLQYHYKGRIRYWEISERESPIRLTVKKAKNYHLPYELTLVRDGSTFSIEDSHGNRKQYKPGTVLDSPIGLISLIDNQTMDWNGRLLIRYLPLQQAVDGIRTETRIGRPGNARSFLVPISMRSSNRKKAELIINSLIEEYNVSSSSDKTSIYNRSGEFINSRIELIKDLLTSADSGLVEARRSGATIDIKKKTELSLKNLSTGQRAILDLKTRLYLVSTFKEELLEKRGLLPVNLGGEDQSIGMQIENLNIKVLEIKDLGRFTGDNHPEYIAIQKELAYLRQNIHQSLEKLEMGLSQKISDLQRVNLKNSGYLESLPHIEIDVRSMLRDRQVVESIYLFLLRKREENHILRSATPTNLKIVDDAYSFSSPISPRPIRVFWICLGIGIMAPILMIYIKIAFDNKIKFPEDLQDLPVPLIGTLPRSAVVGLERHLDSGFTESLRMVRTNIPYMLGRTEVKGAKKILVTSSIPSEGKSFVSVNLATIHSLAGYRVLLIGADLRAPSLSRYLTSQPDDRTNGLSDYLAGNVPYDALLQKDTGPREIDVIFSGTVPPNPAELLLNGRMEMLLDHYSGKYDYIILDSAPYSKVTDTQIIVPLVDLTLYVVRAGVHDKNYIRQLKIYFNSRKFGRTGLILNDFEEKRTFSKIVGNKIL